MTFAAKHFAQSHREFSGSGPFIGNPASRQVIYFSAVAHFTPTPNRRDVRPTARPSVSKSTEMGRCNNNRSVRDRRGVHLF